MTETVPTSADEGARASLGVVRNRLVIVLVVMAGMFAYHICRGIVLVDAAYRHHRVPWIWYPRVAIACGFLCWTLDALWSAIRQAGATLRHDRDIVLGPEPEQLILHKLFLRFANIVLAFGVTSLASQALFAVLEELSVAKHWLPP